MSLYPHILIEYNISPETIVRDRGGNLLKIPLTIDDVINKTADTSRAHDLNVTLPSSGYCFRKDKQGFMPYLCETYYAQRKAVKKSMLKHSEKLEEVHREMEKRGLKVPHH